MKKSTVAAILAAYVMAGVFIPVSCAKLDCGSLSVIRLHAGAGQHTKQSGANDEDESRLNSITFYVFNDNGELEASVSWSDSLGASCEVENGRKRIYAIVNGSPGDTPASEDSLLSALSFIYDNSMDNLVMSGCSEEYIDGDRSIRIPVRRLAGKVEIEEIKIALEDGAGTGITINSLFLTNVNSSISFDGTKPASPENWINKAGYVHSEADRVTYETLGTFIPNHDSHTVRHTFYAYPNITSEDSHSDEYCARYTRLVIDTDYGFYHLDIPGLLGNNSYLFKTVTITSEGSPDPETDEEAGSLEAVLVIEGWEEGESGIERI